MSTQTVFPNTRGERVDPKHRERGTKQPHLCTPNKPNHPNSLPMNVKPRKEHTCRACGVPMRGHFCVRKYFPNEPPPAAPPAALSSDPPEAKRHKPDPSARLRAPRVVDYKDVSDSEESEDLSVSAAPAPAPRPSTGAPDAAAQLLRDRLEHALESYIASVQSDASLRQELEDAREEIRRSRLAMIEQAKCMKAKCDEVTKLSTLLDARGDEVDNLKRDIHRLNQKPAYAPADSFDEIYHDFVCTVARAVSERHAALRQASSAPPSPVEKRWCVTLDTGAKVALPDTEQAWITAAVDRMLNDPTLRSCEKPHAYSNTHNGTTHHYDISIKLIHANVPPLVDDLLVSQRNRSTSKERVLELIEPKTTSSTDVDIAMNEATYSLLDEKGTFVFQKIYSRMRELKFSDALTVEASSDDWTVEQRQAFADAVSKFPSSTADRWQRVADEVPAKTVAECVDRFYSASAALERLCNDVHEPFDARFCPSQSVYTASMDPSALWNFLCVANRKAGARDFFVWMHGTTYDAADNIVSKGIDVDQNVVAAAGKGFYCASNSYVPFHFANGRNNGGRAPAIVMGIGVYDQDPSFRTENKHDFIVKRYRMKLRIDDEPDRWTDVDNGIVVERPQQCAMLPLGWQTWTV